MGTPGPDVDKRSDVTDKSALRRAREARGLSRAAVAEALGTTVHHYYHCEMPPFTEDLGLMRRAEEYLGVSASRDPSEPRLWRCKICRHEEEQPGAVTEVMHKCRGKGKLVRLFPVTEEVL